MQENDLFRRMTREAMEELANGDMGWRKVDSNILMMACFGMLYNHLGSRIVRPLWAFTVTVATGLTWMVIKELFGIS